MGFVKTLKNIFSIEDLRSRIFITFFFVVIYRLGTFVVLPGVSPDMLKGLANQSSSGLLGILNMFSGGAFANASIFALGIMPYITASIVMQLAGIILPYFQKLQNEGESGRTKLNQYTRYLTLIILVVQGLAYLGGALSSSVPGGMTLGFTIQSVIILAGGSMFVLWLGERITDKGIGNGISFIIMVGIIARLPHALFAEVTSRFEATSGGGLIVFLIEILFLMLIVCGAILLVQGTRRIPIQYAKRVVGNKQYGGARQYLPLKVNAANVMPIIFAQAIMFIPAMFTGFVAKDSGLAASLTNPQSVAYNVIIALLIIAFTWLYTAVTINPMQMANELKRNNGFIPGIKPGKDTANFIDTVMSRITFPGSIFLATVAILPAIAGAVLGVNQEFAHFFGGTSLLILVGVVLDTLQQVESHLLNRHYDGLLKTGRIKGRSGSIAAY